MIRVILSNGLVMKSLKRSHTTSSSAVPPLRSWSKLAEAWQDRFIPEAAGTSSSSTAAITAALARTLPLLADDDEEGGRSSDPTVAVPFVCRYRADVIAPLQTAQVHQLAHLLVKHQSLASLRQKLLDHIPANILDDATHDAVKHSNNPRRRSLRDRIATSLSKTELTDIYAPFKAPAKGSLEERIAQQHPHVISAVDALWETGRIIPSVTELLKQSHWEDATIVLANRIARDAHVLEACHADTERGGRIRVQPLKSRSSPKDANAATTASTTTQREENNNNVFQTYHDFEQDLHRLRDHQILAIRRGVEQAKCLQMTFVIDGARAESVIQRALLRSRRDQPKLASRPNDNNKDLVDSLWHGAIHNAWTRLLRSRCTRQCWKALCDRAEERALIVFQDNLRTALLLPPPLPSPPVLALDPGFRAGIKTALVDEHGQLLLPPNGGGGLVTVHFLNGQRDQGKAKLVEMLQIMLNYQHNRSQQSGSTIQGTASSKKRDTTEVVVVLGNGHGSPEARQLVLEASQESGIAIDVHMVNEAGASVWSVTEQAAREFPKTTPAAIAAVSIARRYQNALLELVKIPPRSLGLGMYQHDFAAAVLDRHLHATSVDCVAAVGVDLNAGSLEILQKVPGITAVLAERLVAARPFTSRQDLLQIPGLGPQTYQYCAAFLRVQHSISRHPLDATLVHPESYPLAEYLLRKQGWQLNDPTSVVHVPQKLRREKWHKLIDRAARRFAVSEDRVLSVLDHLVQSITQPDPRLRMAGDDDDDNSAAATTTMARSRTLPSGCVPLEARLHSIDQLRQSCPVRGIIGTIRNVVDFGAFIDLGAEHDGLLHRSQLGPAVSLESLWVGQEIGVDVLGVAPKSHRISLALTGLHLPAIDFGDEAMTTGKKNESSRKPAAKGTGKRVASVRGGSSAKLVPGAKRQKR